MCSRVCKLPLSAVATAWSFQNGCHKVIHGCSSPKPSRKEREHALSMSESNALPWLALSLLLDNKHSKTSGSCTCSNNRSWKANTSSPLLLMLDGCVRVPRCLLATTITTSRRYPFLPSSIATCRTRRYNALPITFTIQKQQHGFCRARPSQAPQGLFIASITESKTQPD